MSETAVAYELREEYTGTVEIVSDGKKQKVPRFGGAVLAVGDGDFHVADSLKAGKGKIVCRPNDVRLLGLLDEYPALKRTSVPDNPVVISPYARRTVEDLRTVASLHDVKGAGNLSKEAAVRLLEAIDSAQAAGDPARVAAIAAAGTVNGDQEA